jgi:peptidyl-prolyl cis-trans isomerase C
MSTKLPEKLTISMVLHAGRFCGTPLLSRFTLNLRIKPMRFARTVSLIALLAVAAPVMADEYVIMKVNNQDVSSSEVQRMWEGLFPAGQAASFDTVKPDMRERILRAVMAEKILYGEALKQGTDKSEKLQRELEDVKKKLIVKHFLDAKTSDMITEADMKKEYDTSIEKVKDEKEVRARHILVPTEQEAKDAKKKIDGGKSFEDVAKELSKDPGSAAQGGDLGYFTRDKMVKEFADAAFALKKGEVSGPVKSGFGYHLIKVEDSRKVTPPTFNDVKEQVRAKLQERKLNDYIGGLVKSSDVKVFDAKGKEQSFEKNLPADMQSPAEPKPAAKPVDKPADKAAEKKPESEKTEKPAEKVTEKKADKPADKPAEKKPE